MNIHSDNCLKLYNNENMYALDVLIYGYSFYDIAIIANCIPCYQY